MTRTKAEIRSFLESKVGTRVPTKPSSTLDGQCVTLIKSLLAELGAPNPWAARGNAKDYGDALIRQGIGTSSKGWLTIVVSRTMGVVQGVTYGHIWIDLDGEANYEQNGKTALRVTKNTRSLSQGQQFINLDKWITQETGGNMSANENFVNNDFTGTLMRSEQPYDPVKKVWRDPAAKGFVGQDPEVVQQTLLESPERKEVERIYALGKAADKAGWKPGQTPPSTEYEEVGNKTGLFQRKK